MPSGCSYSLVAHSAANDSVGRELGNDLYAIVSNDNFIFQSYTIRTVVISGVGFQRECHLPRDRQETEAITVYFRPVRLR